MHTRKKLVTTKSKSKLNFSGYHTQADKTTPKVDMKHFEL